MHRPVRSLLLLPLAALALSGCDKKEEDKNAQAAGGEVLPGTVSDAMIDLDTSTAEPPLQPVQPTGGATGGTKATSAPAADASSTPVVPAPAEAAPAVAAPGIEPKG